MRPGHRLAGASVVQVLAPICILAWSVELACGVRLTSGMVMLFGPRDPAELETVLGVITSSHPGPPGRSP